MVDRRVGATNDFRKRKAVGAKIICGTCGHAVTVSAAVLQLMFPIPVPIDMALA